MRGGGCARIRARDWAGPRSGRARVAQPTGAGSKAESCAPRPGREGVGPLQRTGSADPKGVSVVLHRPRLAAGLCHASFLQVLANVGPSARDYVRLSIRVADALWGGHCLPSRGSGLSPCPTWCPVLRIALCVCVRILVCPLTALAKVGCHTTCLFCSSTHNAWGHSPASTF